MIGKNEQQNETNDWIVERQKERRRGLAGRNSSRDKQCQRAGVGKVKGEFFPEYENPKEWSFRRRIMSTEIYSYAVGVPV